MSWKKSTIGDVLSVIKNGMNCDQNKNLVGDKITRIETIAKKKFDFERVGYAKLSESEKEKSKLKIGDILFSHINSPIHVGKTAIYEGEEDIYHGINLLLMRTKEYVDPYFFNHFLNHLFATGYWEENCKKSVNQASVNQKDISKVEFIYPPLATQKKIVAKLDAIFAEIDKATAAAEANARNAEALFQSYLTQVFEVGGEGWKMMKIGSISKVINGYAFKSTDFNSDDGIKCIKITNVGIREFVEDTNDYLPDSFLVNHSNFLVKEGSIVIPLTRTIIGGGLKVAIVPPSFHKSLLNQRVASIEVVPEIIDGELIYYYLSSSIVTSYVLSRVNTLMQPNLSIKDLLLMPVPIPPKELQLKLKNTISRSIESIFQIKELNIKKINECNLLKQSILKQAFNGELVKE